MREDVDITASETVVIVNGGDGTSFHRQNVQPWRAFACPIEIDAETERLPRLEAELRGYEPCRRANCFGIPE